MKIYVAKDFSTAPTGRFYGDGPYSGERFREELLIPALDSGDKLEIKIDDTSGYGSSFLEEAFGGLVRKGYNKRDLLDRIMITYKDEDFAFYKELIQSYINEA